MQSMDVRHEPGRQRFVLIRDGDEAYLQYRLPQPQGTDAPVVNFTHTYVPPHLRGQGLAEALVRRGLQWARANDCRIEASCWYVAKFLR